MLWSKMCLISKTSTVTPNFFYGFNIILSFSGCSQSLKKICTWEILGANVLKQKKYSGVRCTLNIGLYGSANLNITITTKSCADSKASLHVVMDSFKQPLLVPRQTETKMSTR